MNAMCNICGYTYAFEPGDATRYRFSFYDNEQIVETMGEYRQTETSMLIPGAGKDYVTLIIQMPSYSGSYEFHIESIRRLHLPFIHYAAGKLSGCDLYTVAAVMLAMRVLVDNPWATQKAARAMLQAPELLEGELDYANS